MKKVTVEVLNHHKNLRELLDVHKNTEYLISALLNPNECMEKVVTESLESPQKNVRKSIGYKNIE